MGEIIRKAGGGAQDRKNGHALGDDREAGIEESGAWDVQGTAAVRRQVKGLGLRAAALQALYRIDGRAGQEGKANKLTAAGGPHTHGALAALAQRAAWLQCNARLRLLQ